MQGDSGRFRRNHSVPVPRVNSTAELIERLAAADAADDAGHIDGRRTRIGSLADARTFSSCERALPWDERSGRCAAR